MVSGLKPQLTGVSGGSGGAEGEQGEAGGRAYEETCANPFHLSKV